MKLMAVITILTLGLVSPLLAGINHTVTVRNDELHHVTVSVKCVLGEKLTYTLNKGESHVFECGAKCPGLVEGEGGRWADDSFLLESTLPSGGVFNSFPVATCWNSRLKVCYKRVDSIFEYGSGQETENWSFCRDY